MVEIGDFVHRLGDRKPKNSPIGLELVGRDGNGLVAIGLTIDSRGDQVAQAAATKEVSQADEPPTVPREKYRATTSLAVVLCEDTLVVGGNVELALHHAVGPAKVNQVGELSLAQAETTGPIDWARPDSGVVWS